MILHYLNISKLFIALKTNCKTNNYKNKNLILLLQKNKINILQYIQHNFIYSRIKIFDNLDFKIYFLKFNVFKFTYLYILFYFFRIFKFVGFQKFFSFSLWYQSNLNKSNLFFITYLFTLFYKSSALFIPKKLLNFVFNFKRRDSKSFLIQGSNASFITNYTTNLSKFKRNKLFFFYLLLFKFISFKKLPKHTKKFTKFLLFTTYYYFNNEFNITFGKSVLKASNYKLVEHYFTTFLKVEVFSKYKPQVRSYSNLRSNRLRRNFWRVFFLTYFIVTVNLRQQAVLHYDKITITKVLNLQIFYHYYLKYSNMLEKKAPIYKTIFFKNSNSLNNKFFSRYFRRLKFRKILYTRKLSFLSNIGSKNLIIFYKSLENLIKTKISLVLYFYISTVINSFRWIKIFNLFDVSKLINISSNYYQYQDYVNSLLPIPLLPKSVKFFLKKTKVVPVYEEFSLFFRQYLGHFLENLTEKRVFLKVKSGFSFSTSITLFINTLTTRHRNHQQFLGRGFFLEEMLYIMWTAFFFKDVGFLMSWIRRTMHKIDFKKHKSLIRVIRFFLRRYGTFFFKWTGLKGIRFDVRGKLGVKGNAKKRHFGFSMNHNSFSKKKHRIEYKQGLVYTDTGVLGLTLIFVF